MRGFPEPSRLIFNRKFPLDIPQMQPTDNQKKLSVGVALITYERRKLLRDALRTIQQQTRKPDLVFISDNSKTSDHEVVQEFPDLPIHYHFHDRRLAIDEHWIWCLRQPTTDVIALLEDDNLLRPRHLEVLTAAMERFPDAALAGTAAITFRELIAPIPGDTFKPVWPCNLLTSDPVCITPEKALATYLFGVPFASSAMMVRRSAVEKTPFVESGLKIGHDHWMWAQIALHGPTIFCPETTMLYRDHDVQVVKNFHRSVHRQEGGKCSELIWNYMTQRGVDPRSALRELGSMLTADRKRWMSYLLFRTRRYDLWKMAVSSLSPELSIFQAFRMALADLVFGWLKIKR